jgi:hypothetical protein
MGDTVVVFEPNEPASTWAVWTSSGQTTFMIRKYFQLIQGKPIFKLKTDTARLRETACNRHSKENFEIDGVDYCDLISRIIRKEPAALTHFFELIPQVQAAQAEIHAEHSWQLINLFTDEELKAWLLTLSNQQLDQVMHYLQQEDVAYPITRTSEYLGLYYPRSLEIFEKHK